MVNRNESEPQCVISAPAPGGKLISAPRLSAPGPQDCSRQWFNLEADYNIDVTKYRTGTH